MPAPDQFLIISVLRLASFVQEEPSRKSLREVSRLSNLPASFRKDATMQLLDATTNTLIVALYVFCGLLVKLFLCVYDALNHPRWRYEDDETTESGYEVDGAGRPLRLSNDDEFLEPDVPHIQVSNGSAAGST